MVTFLFQNFEGVANGIRDTLRVLETPRLEETFHLGSEGRDGGFETFLLLGLGAPLRGDGIVVLGLLFDKVETLIELELVEIK